MSLKSNFQGETAKSLSKCKTEFVSKHQCLLMAKIGAAEQKSRLIHGATRVTDKCLSLECAMFAAKPLSSLLLKYRIRLIDTKHTQQKPV